LIGGQLRLTPSLWSLTITNTKLDTEFEQGCYLCLKMKCMKLGNQPIYK